MCLSLSSTTNQINQSKNTKKNIFEKMMHFVNVLKSIENEWNKNLEPALKLNINETKQKKNA